MIWNWIKGLFEQKEQKPESEPSLSHKDGEKLTEYEINLIKSTKKCPDCGGELCSGPEGGCSLNTACSVCYSEFNLMLAPGWISGDRISDKGPRDLGDRAGLYGLQGAKTA